MIEQEQYEEDTQNESENDIESEDEESPQPERKQLPISHEAILSAHTKSVTALSLAPPGDRLISGSYDHDIQMWNFPGMTSNFRPWRGFEPDEGHTVTQLRWNPKGNLFAVATGSAIGKIFDSQGIEKISFQKGDMYLHDQYHTNGHILSLTNIEWNPINSSLIHTSSTDGTIRIWDIERPSKQLVVLKANSYAKISVTSSCYSRYGDIIANTTSDGQLQIWKTGSLSLYQRPHMTVKQAHESGTDTSCVLFSNRDSYSLFTRGGDNTVKIWDTRNFTSPIKTLDNLPNRYPMTDIALNQTEQFLVVGTSRTGKINPGQKVTVGPPLPVPESGNGKLIIFDTRDDYKIVNVMQMGKTGLDIVRILWHPRINQILVGCSDGTIRCLYDPQISRNGALLCAGKTKVKDPSDFLEISLAFSTSEFKGKKGKIPAGVMKGKMPNERSFSNIRKDPKVAHIPEKPLKGPLGVGGRLGITYQEHLFSKWKGAEKKDTSDYREAFLRHEENAKANPLFTNIYQQTQPKTLFRDRTQEDKEKEEEADRERKRPRKEFTME